MRAPSNVHRRDPSASSRILKWSACRCTFYVTKTRHVFTSRQRTRRTSFTSAENFGIRPLTSAGADSGQQRLAVAHLSLSCEPLFLLHLSPGQLLSGREEEPDRLRLHRIGGDGASAQTDRQPLRPSAAPGALLVEVLQSSREECCQPVCFRPTKVSTCAHELESPFAKNDPCASFSLVLQRKEKTKSKDKTSGIRTSLLSTTEMPPDLKFDGMRD